MKTDPHELINIRGYGSAEKALRKAGIWRLTPEEKYENIIDNIGYTLDQAQQSISGAEDHLRDLETAMEATT